MYQQNLEKLILESGLKKKYIAEQLDIKYDTFRRKMNGETDFKVSEIETMCKLLKITVSDIFKSAD